MGDFAAAFGQAWAAAGKGPGVSSAGGAAPGGEGGAGDAYGPWNGGWKGKGPAREPAYHDVTGESVCFNIIDKGYCREGKRFLAAGPLYRPLPDDGVTEDESRTWP